MNILHKFRKYYFDYTKDLQEELLKVKDYVPLIKDDNFKDKANDFEIIKNNFIGNKGDLECKIDKNSIEIIEDADKKIYKSKIQGFVHLDENSFFIDNKIKKTETFRMLIWMCLNKDDF